MTEQRDTSERAGASRQEEPGSCTARWPTEGGMRQCGCLLFAGHEGEHVCVCGPQSGTCAAPPAPPVEPPFRDEAATIRRLEEKLAPPVEPLRDGDRCIACDQIRGSETETTYCGIVGLYHVWTPRARRSPEPVHPSSPDMEPEIGPDGEWMGRCGDLVHVTREGYARLTAEARESVSLRKRLARVRREALEEAVTFAQKAWDEGWTFRGLIGALREKARRAALSGGGGGE